MDKEIKNAIKDERKTLVPFIDSLKSRDRETKAESVERKNGKIHQWEVDLNRGVEVEVDKTVVTRKRVEVGLSHRGRQLGYFITNCYKKKTNTENREEKIKVKQM